MKQIIENIELNQNITIELDLANCCLVNKPKTTGNVDWPCFLLLTSLTIIILVLLKCLLMNRQTFPSSKAWLSTHLELWVNEVEDVTTSCTNSLEENETYLSVSPISKILTIDYLFLRDITYCTLAVLPSSVQTRCAEASLILHFTPPLGPPDCWFTWSYLAHASWYPAF